MVVLAPLFFVLLAYWFLGANLFRGEIVAPMDVLFQYPGWQESGLSLPLFNPERSDILDANLPRWRFMKEALRNGDFPLWNPLAAGGLPAFPHLSAGYLTPRFLLFLLFDDGLGFTLGLLIQAALTGLGAYLLCRTRLGIVASLFGGVTYMMCGFNASWLMWKHTATSLWIPWVLWALIRVVEAPSGRRTAVLAMTVAALVLGGFPSVGAYGLYVAALLFLWLLIDRVWQGLPLREGGRLMLWIGGGVALGFLLASLQVLPFAEFLQQFDLSYRQGMGGHKGHFLTLLWDPFRAGKPAVETTGYVGRLALGLAVVALPLTVVSKRRWGPLSPWFWTMVTGVSLIIVLKTPAALALLLYKLPVLHSNPVNRVLVLFGLGAAVLAAVGLQSVLGSLRWLAGRFGVVTQWERAAALTFAVVLLWGHCVDLVRVGRAQNAVVPQQSFLPQTPTLRYVQERLRPGQSVLATSDAYMVAGSLGSYGLSEWFAHAFHTNHEKTVLANVVRKAWRSRTAAVFSFHQVDLQSPWIDALGIRYVLTSGLSFAGQARNDRPSPAMPAHVLGQTLFLETGAVVRGVEVLLATYGRPSASSDVWLKWFDMDGQVLAETQVAGTAIQDNMWVAFHFFEPLTLPPGRYRFELGMADPYTEGRVTAWAWTASDRFPNGARTVDGKETAGDLAFRVIGQVSTPLKGWTKAMPGDRIVVFERQESPPGAYLVKAEALDREPSSAALSWEEVELMEASSDHRVFRVQTKAPAWLVQTARHWTGWEVYVNGQPREMRTYHGMLPAVWVEAGTSVVEWRYNPLSWKIGLGLSLAGLGALVGLLFSSRLNGQTTASAHEGDRRYETHYPDPLL